MAPIEPGACARGAHLPTRSAELAVLHGGPKKPWRRTAISFTLKTRRECIAQPESVVKVEADKYLTGLLTGRYRTDE